MIDQALFALSNFAVSMLLARWLSPGDYGAFGVSLTVLLFFGVVHTAFLTEPMLVLGPEKYRRNVTSYFRVLTWGHFALSLVAIPAILVVSFGFALFGQGILSRPLAAIALASPVVLFLWLARRACYVLLTPRTAAAAGVLYMTSLLGGVYWLRGQGGLSGEAAIALMGMSSLAASLWLTPRIIRKGASGEISAREVVEAHLQYGRWAGPTSILSWVTGSIALLLLPFFGGLQSVAALKALTNLLLPILHAIGALSLLLIPAFVRAKSEGNFHDLLRRGLGAFCMSAVAYGILLSLISKPFLHWIYDGRYDAVAYLLPALAFFPVLPSVTAAFGSALRALGRPDLVFRAYAVSAVVVLAVAFPVLRYGGIGGAVSLMYVSNGLVAVITWSMIRTMKPWVERYPGQLLG